MIAPPRPARQSASYVIFRFYPPTLIITGMNRPTAKKATSQPAKVASTTRLDPADTELLRVLIDKYGLERIARLAASLTAPIGRRGRHGEPESELLLELAKRVRAEPLRSLHSLATELCREAALTRRPRIAAESLTSKVEREFRRRRHSWLRLADCFSNAGPANAGATHRRPTSSAEYLALLRLIEVTPGAIDLYDCTLSELKLKQPEAARDFRRLGRAVMEPLLERELMDRQNGNGRPTLARDPMLSLIEAIRPEMHQALRERAARARKR